MLDTSGDDDVLRTRHHSLRGEVQGLLGGAALAVHGRAGDVLGQLGREDHVSADVPSLGADLGDAAHNHVLNVISGSRDAVSNGIQDLRPEGDGMPVPETTTLLGAGGADGFDDVGILWTECSAWHCERRISAGISREVLVRTMNRLNRALAAAATVVQRQDLAGKAVVWEGCAPAL